MFSTNQLKALTEHAIALHEARDLEELGVRATSAASQLVACDWPMVALATNLLPAIRHSFSPVDADWKQFSTDSLALAYQDPVYTSRLRLLLDAPASATRMMSAGALEKTDLYDRVWRPRRIRRMMSYLVPGRLSYGIQLARASDRDFTDAEVGLIHALGQHIEAATQRLAGDGFLSLSGRKLPVQNFSWLVSDRAGKVLRASAPAAELMQACLGSGSATDRLPEVWLAELRRRIEGRPPTPQWYSISGRRVSVHIAAIKPTPDEFSVGFLEHATAADPAAALRALGLTAREAEVMRWVAEGKSNAEAGIILGISALTVKKHLENIFHRLNVPNRTAAVVAAMEAMGRRG